LRRLSLRSLTRGEGLMAMIMRAAGDLGHRMVMEAVANLVVAREEHSLGSEGWRISEVGPQLLPPTTSFGLLAASQWWRNTRGAYPRWPHLVLG
jgi:hypothetical protein